MASPSACEGLSKSQIKRRLAEMKKQYELMQKKLEKSDKAARTRSHVKRKIADYKMKRSTGGSPECTAAVSSKALQQEIKTLQDTPSIPAGNRKHLSSDRDTSGSNKKSGKRRSVSFHLTDRGDLPPNLKEKREDDQGETKNQQFACVEARDSDSAQSCESPVNGIQMAKGYFIGKSIRFGKESAATSEHTECQSESSNFPRLSELSEVMVGSGGDKLLVNYDPLKVDLVQERTDSGSRLENSFATTDQQVCSQSSVKTPLEDTQFDMFADTEAPDGSPQVIEVLVDSPDSSGNVSRIKMVTSDVSLQVLSPLGGLGSKSDDRKIAKCSNVAINDVNEDLVQATDNLQLDSERDLVHFQSLEPMCSNTVDNQLDTKKTSELLAFETQTNSILPTTPVLDYSQKRTHQRVILSQSQVTGEGGTSPKNQEDVSNGHSSDNSTEDPDIIPGTYSEEDGILNRDTRLAPKRTQNSSHAVLISDSLSKKDVDEGSQNQPSLLNHPKADMCSSNTAAYHGENTFNSSRKAHLQEMNADSCRNVDEVAHSRHDYEVEEIIKEPRELEKAELVNANSANSENFAMDMSRNESETEMCEKLPGKEGKAKGRRRGQKGIGNLSMDDVSLKDFVLSQQSSQEGSHTWIDGLIYPAEYYVRKTRSMSRHSPNQHSAPVAGQEPSAKGSCSRRGKKAIFSEPLTEARSPKLINYPVENTSREVTSLHHTETNAMPYKEPSNPLIEGPNATKECTSSRKMRVSRKPAATRKRRGRKPLNKERKDEGIALKPCGIESEKNDHKCNALSGQTPAINQGAEDRLETQMTSDGCKDSSPDVALSADATSLAHGDVKYNHTLLSTDIDYHSVADTVMRKKPEKLASMQASHNPLESQFTQTQIPSLFALPRVFGSPGNQSQSQDVPLPFSPSSPSEIISGNAIGSPFKSQVVFQGNCKTCKSPMAADQGTMYNLQHQDYQDNQWTSQAYLADMVPEVAEAECCISPNPDKNSANTTCLTMFSEVHDHEQPPINGDAGIDGTSYVPSGLHDDNVKGSQCSDVSMKSVSQAYAKTDVDTDRCKRHPAEGSPDSPGISSNIDQSADLLPDCTLGAPSSLRSNVDQGSPFADAATGTPPEVADMPGVQSQCTHADSYTKESCDLGRGEIAEGDLDGRRGYTFLFKGCLQHGEEESLDIRSIASSSIVLNGVSKRVTAVHCPSELYVWVDMPETEQGYQLLSSWNTETGESICLVHLCSGTVGHVEAAVVVRDDMGSESIRLIRWGLEKAEWEEEVIMTSADIGQQQACTTLCVLPNRGVAVGVDNISGGSDVLYCRLNSEERERRTCDVVVLPASNTRLNSLTVVEGAPNMIVGVTNSRALLWHVSSHQLVQEFDLVNYNVTDCIQATAESGLLFVVTCKKQGPSDFGKPGIDKASPCCLLALNPSTGRSSKFLEYTAPHIQSGVGILDASVCDDTLAVCLSSGQVCLWDLFSSQLLTSSPSGRGQATSSISLHDARMLLLGNGHCVQIFERNITV